MRRSTSLAALLVFATLAPSLARTAHAEDVQVAQRRGGDPFRLRVGLEGGFGPSYGAVRGAAVGLIGQLGLQLNDRIAFFWQPALFGYGFPSGDDVSAFLATGQSAMVDLTFADFVQVGIGGGVDIGNFTVCDADTGSCDPLEREIHGSFSLRAAFVIGFDGAHARWGFPIALHAHTTFWDGNRLNSLIFAIGVQRY